MIRPTALLRCSHRHRRYLRDLEEPLFPNTDYDKWKQLGVQTIKASDADEARVLDAYKIALEALPAEHHQVLAVMIDFLGAVAAESEHNKMHAKNLAVVFGPSFLRAPMGDGLAGMTAMLQDAGPAIKVVLFMIEHRGVLFAADTCCVGDATATNVIRMQPAMATSTPQPPPRTQVPRKEAPSRPAVAPSMAMAPDVAQAQVWPEELYLWTDVARVAAEAALGLANTAGAFLVRMSGDARCLTFWVRCCAARVFACSSVVWPGVATAPRCPRCGAGLDGRAHLAFPCRVPCLLRLMASPSITKRRRPTA